MAAAARTASGLTLAAILAAWGLTSSITDVLNKAILNEFPMSFTLTMVQFAVSVSWGHVALRVLRLRPHQSGAALIGMRAFWPVAAWQAVGFVTTNMSYMLSAVAFSQTIKVPSARRAV
jgi:hypothetical protein